MVTTPNTPATKAASVAQRGRFDIVPITAITYGRVRRCATAHPSSVQKRRLGL